MRWPGAANERRGTVDVFERALTEFHSVRLPRATNESRGRIGCAESVRTDSVCPPEVPRCRVASLARSSGIDDSAGGESKQLHAECVCAFFRRGGAREAKQSSSMIGRMLEIASQRLRELHSVIAVNLRSIKTGTHRGKSRKLPEWPKKSTSHWLGESYLCRRLCTHIDALPPAIELSRVISQMSNRRPREREDRQAKLLRFQQSHLRPKRLQPSSLHARRRPPLAAGTRHQFATPRGQDLERLQQRRRGERRIIITTTTVV